MIQTHTEEIYKIDSIESIIPDIIINNNITYYCFDKNETEYIFNSFKQRDFFINKYNQKKKNFNYIVKKYDEKIFNLNNMINILNEKSNLKDSIINNKNNKIKNIEIIYKKQLKRNKKKFYIGVASGFTIGLLVGLLL